MEVSPFHISVSEASLGLLKDKLSVATFPDELDEAAWDYGAPLKDVKRLAAYWRDGFDWRKQEEKLNKLPNYRAKISVAGFGELDIHFAHQKSDVKGAVPLLFVHGWPGSFIEVTKLLPMLQGDSDHPAFHVVAPSLPNFGFSSGPKKKGFRLPQYAEVCHKLMLGLGYEQYVTQGGDLGFYVTRMMGLMYPQQCVASHINMIRAVAPSLASYPILALQHAITPYSEFEKRGLEQTRWFSQEGSGYRLEQATKPQTLGYSLADSPVGIVAWIYEKLHDWTDSYPWTDDEVLTWISIYWFSTAGPAASVRIYYEMSHGDPDTTRERPQRWIEKVKLGMAHFPKELGAVPDIRAKTLGPVVWETKHSSGGHFAAWEKPEVIVEDLWGMFGRRGPCASIVKGASGYE